MDGEQVEVVAAVDSVFLEADTLADAADATELVRPDIVEIIAKTFLVIDARKDSLTVCGDICTAMEIMRERGKRARVEDEHGNILAYMYRDPSKAEANARA